jgi:hypothetical protein
MGFGCMLIFVSVVAWFIALAIFPKLPDYDDTMSTGERIAGQVVSVEEATNIKVNGRHPKLVTYSYGDAGEATLMIAMDESAEVGSDIEVRVKGSQAYPEGLRPFRKPGWLQGVIIGAIILGTLLFLGGIIRLLIIGGSLFAIGHSLFRRKSTPAADTPPTRRRRHLATPFLHHRLPILGIRRLRLHPITDRKKDARASFQYRNSFVVLFQTLT